MENFNMGNLQQWKQVATGEVLEFEVPPGGSRNVAFDLIADSFVSVRVITEANAWLVGCGVGQLTIKFATHEGVGVMVDGDPEAGVFIRTWVDTQVIPESRDPSYTTIEPRVAGPSDEMRRVMHIMKINQDRREQQYLEAIAALTAKANEPPQVIEPPAPVVTPPADGGASET